MISWIKTNWLFLVLVICVEFIVIAQAWIDGSRQ